MYSYDLLEPGCYYLVQEEKDSPITLLKVSVETDHCLFVEKFSDPKETEWKRKTDTLFEIIECLTDEAVEVWEKHYNSNEDAYYEEEDDDE